MRRDASNAESPIMVEYPPHNLGHVESPALPSPPKTNYGFFTCHAGAFDHCIVMIVVSVMKVLV
jgi:hypothetical protein